MFFTAKETTWLKFCNNKDKKCYKKRADDHVKTAQSYPSGGFDAASRREEMASGSLTATVRRLSGANGASRRKGDEKAVLTGPHRRQEEKN